ncbi:hypothetical protein [uncultured Thiodictyon sp.]|uniref:hypothetical protein n=1 Tax=uncultured Thiodictyon sp. TaxID=1846217 RepID=UPI0025ED5AE5|nr:hypothetical protein [uncultured Thiodictyon sp.]
MAIRIKSHWSNAQSPRTAPEIAGALAFIAWRIAVDKAINLHCERFLYRDDAQRLAVIAEYLAFLVQIADRLAHARWPDDGEGQRHTLITALARKLAEHLQDNSQDLLGPGDYANAFIDLLNRRSADYADYPLEPAGPSYAFLRQLGYEVQCLMGAGQDNRWVIDQVMDQDAPAAYQCFAKAFLDLFA